MCVIVFVPSRVNYTSEVQLSGVCVCVCVCSSGRRCETASAGFLVSSGLVLLSLAVCPEANLSKGEMMCA